MSEYLVALTYLAFLALGAVAPFVLGLGYIWVDTFYPQFIARNLLAGFPVAAVMGGAAAMAYTLMDRRDMPRLGWTLFLTLFLALWMTLTLLWAVSPASAWVKWDWAVKTVIFAAIIPFLFRTRVQIEAMLLVFLISAGMHLIPLGIKAALTGGGYGKNLTNIPADVGLGESSALATVCVMMIPILLCFRKHSILLPWEPFRSIFFAIYALLCIPGAIGTGARTGIVAMAVLGAIFWWKSNSKVLTGIAVMAIGAGVLAAAPDEWWERMMTIKSYSEEGSAMTRIKVWEWAINWSFNNPFGGSFRAYEINVIYMPPNDVWPEGWIQHGRSPHSTWIELLNEGGYPALFAFLTLIGISLRSLLLTARLAKGFAELAWLHDLSRALFISILVLMAGGSFVGVAFQPWFWLLFASAYCLKEYVRRSTLPETVSAASLPIGSKLGPTVPATRFAAAGRGRR